MLRDQALGASGLLVTVVGGSPVNPYQPQGVWEETTFGAKKYVQGHGEDLYRRSLYTFWRRIVAPTIFFDNGSRQTCNVKQPRTNTPLQALTTLNDVTYLEAARALAARVLSSPPTDSVARIEYAVRSLLARAPSSDELRILLSTLTRSQREFEADPQAAEKLLQIGESPQFRAVTPVEQAAFTVLCGTLLNLDETLTKE